MFKNPSIFLTMALLYAIYAIFLTIEPVSAKQVGLQKAKQVSANWMYEKSRKKYDIKSLSVAFKASEGPDDIYYIINLPSGGWAVVSADDVAQPIIAYAFTGSFSAANSGPPQFDAWMENVKDEIKSAIKQKQKPSIKTEQKWNHLSVDSELFEAPIIEYAVAPLLTTTWNQSQYYNAECPEDASGPGGHAYAGCVATAMAQLIKYHNWPETGISSHSYTPASHPEYGEQSADFESTTYNWTSMPDYLSGGSTASQIDAVATLIFHCGVAVEMDYGPDGSGANISHYATSALESYFKYHPSTHFAEKSSFSTETWLDMLKTEINNNRPVLYRGDGIGSHAFICDGFGDPPDNYFHFNWGWGGYLDGYFLLSDLTPSSYNFTNNQGGIFNVRPVEDLVYPYTEGFEANLPEEWGFDGDRVSLNSTYYHSGAQSILLGTEDGIGYSVNNGTLFINVPSHGATLSFWVKRGYNPAASQYNQQTAQLQDQCGNTILHTFYDGDYNDSQWQEYTLDLSPWSGTDVKFFIMQDNSSTNWKEWTYLDDVSIIINGDINADGTVDLTDLILTLQATAGLSTSSGIDSSADIDGNRKIGIEEAIFILQTLSCVR